LEVVFVFRKPIITDMNGYNRLIFWWRMVAGMYRYLDVFWGSGG